MPALGTFSFPALFSGGWMGIALISTFLISEASGPCALQYCGKMGKVAAASVFCTRMGF